MRKTMWKGIISGIAAGAFLLSSVPVIAEEVVPLSEDIVEYDDEQYSVDVIEEGAVEEDLEVVDSVEEDLSINDLIEDPEEAPDEDAVLMASEENIAINDVNFEDAVFRDLVSRDYDDDEDGYLSSEEISEVEDMDFRGEGIGSLKGIEYFSSLKALDCNNNQLTSLDVSQNQALTDLYCGYNNITNLDVSQNTALGELYCGGNPLQNLDLSKNTNLNYLYCGSCQLTSLDVSQNPRLLYLNFEDNMITSVNLSQNTNLDRLYCGGNKLSSLDVSNNTALTGLYCYANLLTSLNVSNNPELNILNCQANQLTVLDISNCPKIKETYVSGEYSNEEGAETYIIYEVDDEDDYRYVDSALYFDPGVSIKTEAETGHTHTFGAWTVTVPATEDAEGQQVRTCPGCGQTETAIIPRLAVNISVSKKPSISKPKAEAKGKATITWKKFKQTKKTKAIWKKIKKVEVQYSTDPTFRTNVTKKLVGKGKTKLIAKGLQKNTTYYVRIRYTDGAGGYSQWGGTKKFKTKKK